MSDKTQLLPCPCCAGEAKEMYTYLTSVEWVQCLKCGLETKGFSNAEAAAKAWNTRAAPPQPDHSAQPVGIVDESDDGLFIELLYGDNGNPLKRGDKVYTQPLDTVQGDAQVNWRAVATEHMGVIDAQKQRLATAEQLLSQLKRNGWNRTAEWQYEVGEFLSASAKPEGGEV